MVAEIATVVKAAAKDAKVMPRKLAGIGSAPGRVDAATGELFGAANVSGGGDRVPWERWSSAVGVERVVVDNDVVVATLAEHRLGAGRGFDDLLTVFAGSGWAAPSSSGPAKRGHGAAGEIGHVVVVDGGELRPCGRRGCMEAYVGRVALERGGVGGRPPAARPSCWPSRSASAAPDDQRGLEGGPGRRRPAGPRADRPGHRGPGRGHRLGRQPGRRPGRPDRRRPGRQARRAVRRVETAMVPHLFLPTEVVVRLGELGDYAGALGRPAAVRDGQAGARAGRPHRPARGRTARRRRRHRTSSGWDLQAEVALLGTLPSRVLAARAICRQ